MTSRTRHSLPQSPRNARPDPKSTCWRTTPPAPKSARSTRASRARPSAFKPALCWARPGPVRATSSGDSRRPGPAPASPRAPPPPSSYGLPAPETLCLGPPGRFASVAGTSSDPSQPSLGHTNRRGPGPTLGTPRLREPGRGLGPTLGAPNFLAEPVLLTPTHSSAGLLHRQALCSHRPRRPHSHTPPQVFRYPSPNPAHAIIHTPPFYFEHPLTRALLIQPSSFPPLLFPSRRPSATYPGGIPQT